MVSEVKAGGWLPFGYWVVHVLGGGLCTVHTYCTTVPVGVHTVPGTRWTPLHYRVPQVVVHVVLHTCSMYKPYVVCTVLVLVVVHVVHVIKFSLGTCTCSTYMF